MNKQNIKVAVDAVVFGYQNQQVYILLIQQKYGAYQGQWALPGGFVLDGEGLTQAVHRELKEEAGITVKYLEQLYTFGDDINRDSRAQVISVSYFALVDASAFELKADTDAEDAQWFALDSIPKLAYDHSKIIDIAYKRLQAKVRYQPIGLHLLQPEFPFSDLEHLYSAILQKKIERRNFRKKILDFQLLEETGKFKKEGSGRPGKIYRFNTTQYQQLLEEGFNLELKSVNT